MRAILLSVSVGLCLMGCCSTHRSWTHGYGACVPQCDTYGCHDLSSTDCRPKKVGLFSSTGWTSSHSRASCPTCSPFASDCGCGAAHGEIFSDGMASGGCATCGESPSYVSSPAMESFSGSWCASCQQHHAPSPPATPTLSPTPAPALRHDAAAPTVPQPVPPPPPTTDTALPPAPPVPAPIQAEPTEASYRQPLLYQNWTPHQAAPLAPQMQPVYSPAAAPIVPAPSVTAPATAVQPVLWVPAAP